MEMSKEKMIWITVAVAALGYLVDIYDLILFSVVRVQSLKDLGLSAEQIKQVGADPLAWQMGGMLIGGLVWGIMGDKLGRLSVLFGSILLYSLANAANAYVTNLEQYEWLRFVAGIGLAGELGAGITLVSEVMSKENRGIGTTIVAGVGVAGAVLAYFVSITFDWRTAYLVGAGMGLGLLLLRVSVFESGLFGKIKNKAVSRGNFFILFRDKYLFIKYLKCILIGLPTWFVLGQLVTLAPEFGKNFGMTDAPENPGAAVMWCYVGLIFGDLASGFLSQYLKSRRKALLTFITIATFTTSFYLLSGDISRNFFYFKIFLLGIGMGYWALFVMVGAEHFGTNIRATVTTTVPNFARGLLVPIAAIMKTLKDSIGLINAAWVLFAVTFVIAALAMYFMEETFGKDLDYVEE